MLICFIFFKILKRFISRFKLVFNPRCGLRLLYPAVYHCVSFSAHINPAIFHLLTFFFSLLSVLLSQCCCSLANLSSILNTVMSLSGESFHHRLEAQRQRAYKCHSLRAPCPRYELLIHFNGRWSQQKRFALQRQRKAEIARNSPPAILGGQAGL